MPTQMDLEDLMQWKVDLALDEDDVSAIGISDDRQSLCLFGPDGTTLTNQPAPVGAGAAGAS